MRDNVFNGTMMGGLLLSAEITWLEGNLGLEDITVTNNTFVDCCSYRHIANFSHGQCNRTAGGHFFPVFSPGGVQGLRLENNTIVDVRAGR